MRKIIVLSFISLDGVMQAPGGPEEDTSNGFKYGGWTVPYFDDSAAEVMTKQLSHEFDLLLGRKTYDIFAAYWPNQNEKDSFVAKSFNKVKKYVASRSSPNLSWKNSILLKDAVQDLKKLKKEDGPELQVHGSGDFVQTLLKNDLVDELWLKIYPVTLGKGKRLFADGVVPSAFKLSESSITPRGVIVANYERAGEVKTGSF